MAEPGEPPGLAEVVRRWVARLARTDGVELTSDQLEKIVTGIALDAVDTTGQPRNSAVHRFSALFSSSPMGIALANPDGEIVEANAAMGKLLGQRAEELRGRKIAELGFSDRDTQNLLGGLEELVEDDAEHNQQRVRLAHAEDAEVWADITLTNLPGDKPNSVFPVLMAVDANDLHTLQETLRHQSVHDALTGLSNASRFKTMLENALNPSARDQIALIYLDLDGFRVINDGLGAGVGDLVLRGVARKLKNVFTSHEALVARLSGDGFAVLLRGRLTPGEVIAMVETAMEELAEPIYLGEQGIGVSASAGIVVRNVSGVAPEDVERAAELALHRAKEAGRAQWMLFDTELDTRDRARYRLGAELAGALENGQFELEYHPAVSLSKPRELMVAAVPGLRWHHPDLGTVTSEVFGPLATTTGMTTQMGKWVIAEALKAAARWREEFGDRAPYVLLWLPRRMAIDPDLVKIVRDGLDKHNLPPASLRMWTQPKTIVDRHGEVLDSLVVLAELGVKLVLTVRGSADLEIVAAHNLAVRDVVLAGQVVDLFADGEPDEAAVRHLEYLVSRATELKLRPAAEGVRSEEHARRLRRHGVLFGRGPFVESATVGEIDGLIRRYLS